VSVRTFLRVLGAIYCIAFVSFGVQASGLVGSKGILPYGTYLGTIREAVGKGAFWSAPTLLWLSPTEGALRMVWFLGVAAGLVAVFGLWQRAALAVCLILWISICTVGQDFLSFQWDILLSEAGFLALFADASPVRVFLFRWLLFRLMFSSGVVKLASGDSTWRNLTAMSFHYETQPLPTALAWYAHQFPGWFQRVSTLMVFLVELPVPFLFFGPRRVRRIAGWITIAFQLLIMATGNYTFFNVLTIALVMFLFIEWKPAGRSVVSVLLAVFIGVTSSLVMLETLSIEMPDSGMRLMRWMAPLRIVNGYGLFAVMTTERKEIVIEGSDDGENWKEYEFRYKPGDVNQAPRIVEPHQPRLDWQMWFAALGTYQENRWFVNLVGSLLHGETDVLRLLKTNPFTDRPPKYVRARLYRYHFTHWGERAWWSREERGLYFPPVSLK